MGDTTNERPRPARRCCRAEARALLLALGLTLIPGGAALAQDESLDDVFGGFGTVDSSAQESGAPAPAARAGEGTILGQVFDADSGSPVGGVTVIVTWPPPSDGSEPRIEVQVTDAGGSFEFASIPAGSYTVSFSKSGYRPATMNNFAVQAGQLNRADFPLPPLPVASSDQVLQLDAFVVEADTVGEMMNALEIRMDSDLQLNIMSAEDFAKFASSDVADALTRVAGVNVVEGQFAIIRGLEDRYSSTLFNSAVIPSPDPDRQSVQLDLFPSEVVSNLVVAKTFGPELPSNSSGGSIDIVTHDEAPEGFTFSVKGGVGFNENALDRFLDFTSSSPVPDGTSSGAEVLGPEAGVFFAGRTELLGREIRFKGVFNWELDYDTAEGFQETREPARALINAEGTANEGVISTGDLAFGELGLSGGRFDLTTSQREEQFSYYGGLGLDLDRAGNHRVDASVFYTDKKEETVQLRDQGFIPDFPYQDQNPNFFNPGQAFIDPLTGKNAFVIPGSFISRVKDRPTSGEERDGPVYWSYFADSRSFGRDRDLLVTQLNGSHRLDEVPGLEFKWAGNWSRTTQDDSFKILQYFYQPDCGRRSTATVPVPAGCVPNSFPATVESLGPGQFGGNARASGRDNDVEETSWFVRGDGKYERELGEMLQLTLSSGGWYENADRDVVSQALATPTGNFFREADTAQELGTIFFVDESGNFTAAPAVTNDSEREIWAWNIASKVALWDRFDVFGGVRLENIRIESDNDPFTGKTESGTGLAIISPSRYLMFDRRDNPNIAKEQPTAPAFTAFNDQILRQPVVVDRSTTVCDKADAQTGTIDRRGCVDLTDEDQAALLSGQIDETKWLPAVGFAVRPLEGVVLRGAWSQTVARPSFRELGYYISNESASDDLIIGNPNLQLSDVTSYDLRLEYVFGESDLIAVSGFHKKIEDPIEAILVRDPSDFTRSGSQFRTFFNNPNDGDVWGVEVEARKALDFVPRARWLRYVSIGGNFTYIDAEVDRSEIELARAEPFFAGCQAGANTFPPCALPDDGRSFDGLSSSRRLFGQPEWIANADITFNHPDWGTQVTLAFFAISDVLDAAGGPTFLDNSGFVQGFGLDRYVDSFHTLDLIMSQSWSPDFMRGARLGFKFRVRNLTDSKRGIVYDPDTTAGKVYERRFRVGRDYKFSMTVAF